MVVGEKSVIWLYHGYLGSTIVPVFSVTARSLLVFTGGREDSMGEGCESLVVA